MPFIDDKTPIILDWIDKIGSDLKKIIKIKWKDQMVWWKVQPSVQF